MSTWRMAGLNYVNYSNIAARVLRKSLKSELRDDAAKRDQSFIKVSYWAAGERLPDIIRQGSELSFRGRTHKPNFLRSRLKHIRYREIARKRYSKKASTQNTRLAKFAQLLANTINLLGAEKHGVMNTTSELTTQHLRSERTRITIYEKADGQKPPSAGGEKEMAKT